jgi:hypothetical protein
MQNTIEHVSNDRLDRITTDLRQLTHDPDFVGTEHRPDHGLRDALREKARRGD